jgi:hypothetical protein
MKINIFETNIITFTRETNSVHFNYFFCDLLIALTDDVKDLGVMLASKLHFQRHVDCLKPQTLKLLRLIRFITYNFSSLDSINVFYVTSVPSKLEYASVIWKKYYFIRF